MNDWLFGLSLVGVLILVVLPGCILVCLFDRYCPNSDYEAVE